ncbi:MAG: hypothetical protein WBP81_00450 [Solirubrobacteraceae bacterium]
MADGKRTILHALRELMKLARGAFGDLDLDGVLERVVAAARQVSSARYAPLGVLDRSRRELERFLTAGVDEVTRRRIYALRRGRGVLAELIADPVPLRVEVILGPVAKRGRAVVSARTATSEREHDWTGTSG